MWVTLVLSLSPLLRRLVHSSARPLKLSCCRPAIVRSLRVRFYNGPLGLTFRKDNGGQFIVEAVVKGSQAECNGITIPSRIERVASQVLNNKMEQDGVVAYIQSLQRPFSMLIVVPTPLTPLAAMVDPLAPPTTPYSTSVGEAHSLDTECGGYFTALSRSGALLDDTKYVWLQGRAVFMWSRLYNE